MNKATGLQAILNQHLPAYQQHHSLSPEQQKACYHIQQCRTKVLGGLQQQCNACGVQYPQYHSCRDRHCPQCQGQAQYAWSEQQQQSALPVNYYHLVFTLPHHLNGWVELHPDELYRRLFQSVWATLDKFGQDPKRLQGKLGMTAVLHTWGQNLSRHVHLHCLVPGGALTDQGQWHPAKSNYLFPVKALSRYYRGHLVSLLRQSAQQGKLQRITRPNEINQRLNELMKIDWVVYTKACYQQGESIVNYLARYSKKIALNNSRLQTVDDQRIQLRYKDYRDNSRHKVMHLDGQELIRRFLLHILPKGFMRIRHYGFLANRCRQQKLAQIRQILSEQQPDSMEQTSGTKSSSIRTYTDERKNPTCPHCKKGQLLIIGEIHPKRIGYG